MRQTGCDRAIKLMPAKGIFALGVGHVRRKASSPATNRRRAGEDDHRSATVQLTDLDWQVLIALKREFDARRDPRQPLGKPRRGGRRGSSRRSSTSPRASTRRSVIGRFSTFLEHVKPSQTGERVTQYNALFHWAVPPGREIEAGGEVGRFHIMTHAYWREGGPEFDNVNIMGVAHGTDKDLVLAHKRAIDEHLEAVGIPVSYTNVFWGGRSEIKPSEISPDGASRVDGEDECGGCGDGVSCRYVPLAEVRRTEVFELC